MFAIPGLIIGFLFGVYRARKLGGNRADQLQYGAGFGLAFFLLALFGTIMADWMGLV